MQLKARPARSIVKLPAETWWDNNEFNRYFADSSLQAIETVELEAYDRTVDVDRCLNLLCNRLPDLDRISLIANVRDSDRAVSLIDRAWNSVRSHNLQFLVILPISRIESPLVQTLDRLQHREEVPTILLAGTILNENIYDLHDLLEFAIARNLYLYYRSPVHLESLDFDRRYHLAIFLNNLIKFYERSEERQRYYRAIADRAIDNTDGNANPAESCWTPREFGQTALPTPPIEDRSPTLKQLLRQLKLLQPLKAFKARIQLRDRLKLAGVNLATLPYPQPSHRFPQSRSTPAKVLIFGWYGTETLGDKAILGGVVRGLQAALGDLELHLGTFETYISQMSARQMPELAGCQLHSMAEAAEVAADMDLVAFGGGPIMAIGVLAETVPIFQNAVTAGVPTLIAGCGVGPLGSAAYNETIAYLLQHASHRIYRDEKSKQIATSLGVDTRRDRVAEDPAFTWLYQNRSSENLPETTAPRLLLGWRDWPYYEYAMELSDLEAQQLKQRFETELVAALEILVKTHPDLQILPFPMCTNHLGEDDRWFYRRLFRGRDQLQNALDLSYLGAELSPQAYLHAFQTASAALTMRYHSLVFALSMGLPAVSIDYTLGRGKVKALAEKYRIPSRSLDAIDRDFLVSSVSQVLQQPRGFETESPQFSDAVGSFIAALAS